MVPTGIALHTSVGSSAVSQIARICTRMLKPMHQNSATGRRECSSRCNNSHSHSRTRSTNSSIILQVHSVEGLCGVHRAHHLNQAHMMLTMEVLQQALHRSN